jgi:hypothetical protein
MASAETPSAVQHPSQSAHALGAAFLLLAIGSLGLAGCSESYPALPTYEVKGKVLLASGKPLSAGRVTFVAQQGKLPEVSGVIQQDGSFALTTRSDGDGAAPGDYKVRIEPAGRKNARTGKLSFPSKYVDEDSSGLRVTVLPQANQLEPFTLK